MALISNRKPNVSDSLAILIRKQFNCELAHQPAGTNERDF